MTLDKAPGAMLGMQAAKLVTLRRMVTRRRPVTHSAQLGRGEQLELSHGTIVPQNRHDRRPGLHFIVPKWIAPQWCSMARIGRCGDLSEKGGRGLIDTGIPEQGGWCWIQAFDSDRLAETPPADRGLVHAQVRDRVDGLGGEAVPAAADWDGLDGVTRFGQINKALRLR
jgi:hypothetical protein